VKISELTEGHFRKYYESRLSDNKIRKSGNGYIALCCFHKDQTPSLSLNFEKGVWKCHAGCGAGGIIDFEMKFSSCDKDSAIIRIAEIVGEARLNFGQQPEQVYSYTDAFGKLMFQVLRYPGKRFAQRRPDEKGGWIYQTSGMKMLLYNLPDVVSAKNIIVCEGEKDANNLKAALNATAPQLAVTTSPRGAGRWLDEFGVFTAGKQVVVLADNDDPGRNHAQQVAASCYRWAAGVKLLELPGLQEHGDTSDFLKTHKAIEIVELAKTSPWWRPPSSESPSLFMTVTQFREKAVRHQDWLVEGLIQRGTNGMMIARPKCGKSFAILDLALALAGGQKWLDFYVPKRVRTALVSREDFYGLTQWREQKLASARRLTPEELDGYLYINAKGLKPKVMLDYPEDVSALIADLKRYKSEFLILDVMRVLHGAEENDNTDMQKIIDVLNHIQSETGASVCLIHHDNKREDATLTERARGASAIAGWAEFICGIKVVEETNWTREFACELKASLPPDKFYWRIIDTADNGIELARVKYDPPTVGRKRKTEKEEDAPF
jgi:putative DNA primase/helicase